MCGNYYIQPEQLRYMRRIGTGTFATVHVAQLLPPAGAAVPLPTPTKTQNDLSHHSTFSESSSCGRRPLHEWYGQQVAVKRLNRAALTNARDFSDFVMEASVLQKIQHKYVGGDDVLVNDVVMVHTKHSKHAYPHNSSSPRPVASCRLLEWAPPSHVTLPIEGTGRFLWSPSSLVVVHCSMF